jgi:hypothetical protein
MFLEILRLEMRPTEFVTIYRFFCLTIRVLFDEKALRSVYHSITSGAKRFHKQLTSSPMFLEILRLEMRPTEFVTIHMYSL